MKVRIVVSRWRKGKIVTTRYYIERRCWYVFLPDWEILSNNGCPIWFERRADAEEWIRLYNAIKRR